MSMVTIESRRLGPRVVVEHSVNEWGEEQVEAFFRRPTRRWLRKSKRQRKNLMAWLTGRRYARALPALLRDAERRGRERGGVYPAPVYP